jgi:hypothetical protein
MEPRSRAPRVNAVPALVACVAIAFATLVAERKLNPGGPDRSAERRHQPLLAPAGLAVLVQGDRK